MLSNRTFCDNEIVLSALSSETVTNHINLTLIDLVYLLGPLALLRFRKDHGLMLLGFRSNSRLKVNKLKLKAL